MLAALETGLGKIPNSRMIALGTQPEDVEHWFSGWLTGSADYCQIHAAAESDPVHHKKTWRRANPSIAYLPSLAQAIARDSGKAKTDSRALQAFKSLRLNLPVPDTTAAELLTPAELALCETENLPERDGQPIFGVDLGATAAMSAVAAYWAETGLLEVLGAFPSIPSLKERGEYDGVGDSYSTMLARGEIFTTEGRTVDVAELLETAIERFGYPAVIVADRYRAGELLDAMDGVGLDVGFVPRGQGFRDGSDDVRRFRRACLDGQVKTAESLLMRSALSGARVVSDPAGNVKLAKAGDGGGRKSRHRDDAAAAMILAVAEGQRQPAPVVSEFGGYIGLAG